MIKIHLVALVSYLVSNAGSLGLGGYLGYRFGDKVEQAVVGLYTKLEGLLRLGGSAVKK